MGRASSDYPGEAARSDPSERSLPAHWEPLPVEMNLERANLPAASRPEPLQPPPISVQVPQAQHPPGAPPAYPGYLNPTQTINVNVNTPVMPMVVTAPSGPPLIARVLWYLFIGWWLSALTIVLGYALMVTIIGIPVAFALFNRIPQALTLRPRTVRYGVEMQDGVAYLTSRTIQQRPWYLRALYFLFIGWWFGAVWLVAAWAIGLLIVTLPISFLMYNRTSAVMTLQRH